MGVMRGPVATAASVGLVVIALLLTFFLVVESRMCDGVVQRFQIPDDNGVGGCQRVIPEWHGIFPWNWGKTDLVCLGMCPSDVPMWTRDK